MCTRTFRSLVLILTVATGGVFSLAARAPHQPASAVMVPGPAAEAGGSCGAPAPAPRRRPQPWEEGCSDAPATPLATR